MPRGGVAPLYEWLEGLGDQAAPLVLCSAYIESELMRRGVMAEEIVLLRKPFSPGALVATASHIHAKRGRVASSSGPTATSPS